MILAPCVLIALEYLATVVQEPVALPPAPDAAVERDTLKKLRELFKDDYSRRLPAERSAFAKTLFKKGVETLDDLPTKYVLLSEACELAVGANDIDTSLKASREISRSFAVDGQALNLSVVSKLAASIRDPESARTLARACFPLVSDAVRAETYEPAISLIAKAGTLAKTAQDANLLARLQDLKKDVDSLKDEFARVKPMLGKPTDSEAFGRYLCFVRGTWEAGLPHLSLGARPPLKPVVDKDLLNPKDAATQVELAEAWSEIARKEKSPWRRSRIQSRVRFWLENAQGSATGVLRLRIEKLMSELEEPEPGAVNLLRMIDPRQDSILGDWSFETGILVSPTAEWARAQVPYTPPDEYDLTLIVERREGGDSVVVGLGQGKSNFALWIDGHPAKGGRTGLDLLDGVVVENNPASVTGMFLTNGKPSTILIAVRKTGVSATIDGKTVLHWQGNFNRLAQSPVWKARDTRSPLFLGAYGSRVHFSKFVLTPITGEGKKTR